MLFDELLFLLFLVSAFFATKRTANRYGMWWGIAAFIGLAIVYGLTANALGIDLSVSDCFDYGVRAKGC